MNWIWNQKMQKPVFFLGSVMVCIAQLTILNVCMLMMFAIHGSRGTDWYQVAYTQELSNDMLFAEKSGAVFLVLGIAVVFVCIFSIFTMLVFRKNQWERMKTEAGIYLMSGYEEENVRKMLNVDLLMDLVVAFPFVLFVSKLVLGKISEMQEFQLMFAVVSEMPGVYVLTPVIGLLVLFMICEKYCKYWLEKYIKCGLIRMITQEVG